MISLMDIAILSYDWEEDEMRKVKQSYICMNVHMPTYYYPKRDEWDIL